MSDHIVRLPEHFQPVYQFQNGKSAYRCGAACLAMIGQIAFPGRWQSVSELMSQIYSHYAGADTPDNHTGMTVTQVLDWLHVQGIGHINMQQLVGSQDALRAEIQAMNLQSVCQVILVADESKLRYATNGEKLHNWVDTGMPHFFLRVGFSDDHGYGLYYEPAAGLAFPKPVPILWHDIAAAGVEACIAIMPNHVDVPPAGFSYQSGVWPHPKVVLDTKTMVEDLRTAAQVLDAAGQTLASIPNTPFNHIPDLLTAVTRNLSSVQAAHQRLASDLEHA